MGLSPYRTPENNSQIMGRKSCDPHMKIHISFPWEFHVFVDQIFTSLIMWLSPSVNHVIAATWFFFLRKSCDMFMIKPCEENHVVFSPQKIMWNVLEKTMWRKSCGFFPQKIMWHVHEKIMWRNHVNRICKTISVFHVIFPSQTTCFHPVFHQFCQVG